MTSTMHVGPSSGTAGSQNNERRNPAHPEDALEDILHRFSSMTLKSRLSYAPDREAAPHALPASMPHVQAGVLSSGLALVPTFPVFGGGWHIMTRDNLFDLFWNPSSQRIFLTEELQAQLYGHMGARFVHSDIHRVLEVLCEAHIWEPLGFHANSAPNSNLQVVRQVVLSTVQVLLVHAIHKVAAALLFLHRVQTIRQLISALNGQHLLEGQRLLQGQSSSALCLPSSQGDTHPRNFDSRAVLRALMLIDSQVSAFSRAMGMAQRGPFERSVVISLPDSGAMLTFASTLGLVTTRIENAGGMYLLEAPPTSPPASPPESPRLSVPNSLRPFQESAPCTPATAPRISPPSGEGCSGVAETERMTWRMHGVAMHNVLSGETPYACAQEVNCVACMSRPFEAMMEPCSHASLCWPCWLEVEGRGSPRCPICRSPTSGVKRGLFD